jgi:hypothetical protein
MTIQLDSATSDLLRTLAEKLGTTTEYLWAVMVRGETVYGFLSLIGAAFAATIAIFAFKLLIKEDKWFSEHDWDVAGVKATSFLIIITAMIIAVTFLFNGLYSLLAPEAKVLANILGAL